MTEGKNKNQEETAENEKVTLLAFIEDNHKIISVLGIFTALTVFTSSLKLKPIGNLLSFMFLTLTILVWFELWGRFPSKDTTSRLSWFETILSFAILGIVVYWLLEYRTIWHKLLVVPIFGIIVVPFSKIMKRYDIFNRLFHTKSGKLKTLRYIFGVIVILVFASTSFFIASMIEPHANKVLDRARQAFETNSKEENAVTNSNR